MKHKLILATLFIFSITNTALFAQENYFIKEYIERLENSKKYLLLVTENMPEDKYDFKATPESLSFAENLMHIGWAMAWLSNERNEKIDYSQFLEKSMKKYFDQSMACLIGNEK